MKILLVGMIGLAGGVIIGGGIVALFVVLDMIPRLAQLTLSFHRSRWFERAMVCGVMFWMIADFWNLHLFEWLGIGKLLCPIIGFIHGIFIGLFAAALTEVTNVLPILAKRLHMTPYLVKLLWAMVLGKISGSLLDWCWFQFK